MAITAAGPSGDDFAKDSYGGTVFPRKIASKLAHLRDIGEQHVDTSVKKMAFVELREEGSWSIQGLVMAGTEVSREMVKWVGSLKPKNFVSVEATVKRPLEPVKSPVFCEAPAPESLGLSLQAANKAVTRVDEEENVVEGVEDLTLGSAVPAASLATHIGNPVMHKRAPVAQAISNVRITVRKIFTEYVDARGFNLFEPPCLIGAASEGGSNIEIAGGRKVYSIGPTFRAENSNTRRHLTEFFVMDLEKEIEEHYHEVLDLLKDLLLHIFRQLEVRCKDEIELVRSPGKEVRITFADGQKLLREEGPEEYKNYKTDFYILDKFPESARPFYAMLDPENPDVTNAFDFFMRGQEVLSGGQRIHLPDMLESRIRDKGIGPVSPGIKEYLDVFKLAGVLPYGGGGIGLDRVVAWYLALPTVHLCAYYPRTPKRLLP
ncbi:hypothetical protein B0T26DRAFT_744265 [Lasiosphaeria miniovina]|uniref:aspartate--tRNA ligase n=1 Tax=Lasiosphaeria miniovina TaxID=1954250 RepID=A0AA39ZTJ2_9PEZI|nr:uncharacterized protein B0T26DRAFT_744265 [Lasiosphaeria miniovina]KAK0703441.1 hypothetical protein B0T26DRAFT_744265 [Lasiosphaeria miniovina]